MSGKHAAAPRSPYITRAGYDKLKDEAAALWVKRREVTVALAAAAAEGDRSENAEYIYRKKQLRELDRRIRYLQKRLPELKVVEQFATCEQVFFGAWVELEDDQGNLISLRIVGSDEFNPADNWISVDSPMARGLLKSKVDDEVQIHTPEGARTFFVLSISYSG